MFKNKLKQLTNINKEENISNNKKKIENLIVLLIVLCITIFVMNYILNEDSNNDSSLNTTSNKQLASEEVISIDLDDNNIDSISYDLEVRLEYILSQISGVGEAKVLINYSSSEEAVPMYDESIKESTTVEQDTEGGTRDITETDVSKQIIYEDTSEGSVPVISKSTSASIEGAIITATGANDITVKSNIISAVEAVTGLSSYKIQVFAMD